MDRTLDRLITLNRALGDLILQYKEHLDMEERIRSEGPAEYQPALEMTQSLGEAIIADVPETLGLVHAKLSSLAGIPEKENTDEVGESEPGLEEDGEREMEREWSLQLDPFAFVEVWVDTENVMEKLVVDVNLEKGYHQVTLPFELPFDKLESLYRAAQTWHGEAQEEERQGYLPLEEKMPELDHVSYELNPYSPSEQDIDNLSGEQGSPPQI